MNIVTDLKEWINIRKSLNAKTIGLVTTMGNLHEGHRNLCERAKNENEISVITIFVNPTQFNERADFNRYPRKVDEDCKKVNVDYILIPKEEEIYFDRYHVQVNETNISRELEGEHRPGHFTGMLTIVLKLLNLVQPTRVYFGEKDYQQLLLVKKMVASLFVPTEVIGCETIRADQGLALSSRNSLLNETQFEKSKLFYQLLSNFNLSIAEVTQELNKLGFKVDYIAEKWQRRLGAVWIDQIRLIDNVKMESEKC